MFGYIYKTTNLINNKIYIGKRSGLFKSNYFGSGTILKRALKKYGFMAFKVEKVLEAKNEQMLNLLEIRLISFYRTFFGPLRLYNIANGGEGSVSWAVTSRQKISYQMKGKRKSLAHRQKIAKTLTGTTHPCSLETKQKISRALKGKKRKPWSQQHKEMLSLLLTGRKHSEETKKKLSLQRKGRLLGPQSELTRHKKSLALKGKNKGKKYGPHTLEWKQYIKNLNAVKLRLKIGL